jgi:hypothetical protein
MSSSLCASSASRITESSQVHTHTSILQVWKTRTAGLSISQDRCVAWKAARVRFCRVHRRRGECSSHILLPPLPYNKKCLTRVFPLARHSAPPMRRPRFPISALLCSDPGPAAPPPPARCTDCTSERIAPLTLWSSRFCRTRPSRWKRQTGRSFEGGTSTSRTRTKRHPTPTRTARCHNTTISTTNSRTLDGRRHSAC